MKVLFIGGTGIISTACTALAMQRGGFELFLLNRGQRGDLVLPKGVKEIRADIRDAAATRAALKGMTFDSVVNWIAYTPEHVEADIELFRGRTGQYVFISSASAYQKPVTHYLITESTPLANPYWEYSRNKIACEERLMREYRESGFPFTTVRPSQTYGDTSIPHAVGTWNDPWTIADRIIKGKPVLVHGDGTSLWVTTHNTDFAKAFLGLLGNPQTIGHAFHITTDEVNTWNEHTTALGWALGVEPKIVHVATDTLLKYRPEERGPFLGDKCWSVVFDNTKIKRFVPDFVATTKLREGMKQTVNSFKAEAKRQTVDEKTNDWIDRIVADALRHET